MDFEWSEEQELLRETLRRFFADRADEAGPRARFGDEVGVSDATWRALADLGVTGLLVDEQGGGAGLGMLEMGVVLGEAGRALFPGPILTSCCVATRVLEAHGTVTLRNAWAPRLARGDARLAVAIVHDEGPTLRARADDAAGARLSGEVGPVLNAAGSDAWLVAAEYEGAPALFLVGADAAGARARRIDAVDGTRRLYVLALEDAPGEIIAEGAAATAALAEARDLLAVGLATDAVGAAEHALELALAHARARTQFGRAIGSFQAVQHMLVDMLREIELVRAATIHALWSADHAAPEARAESVAVAKAAAAELLPRVGAAAIQVFGGIGFTWELDVHLFDKRLSSQALLGGDAHHHLETIAAASLDAD